MKATVIAEEPGGEFPEITADVLPNLETISISLPHVDDSSPPNSNSDSDPSGSANGSASSFSNLHANNSENSAAPNRAIPSPDGAANGSESNGKGDDSRSPSPAPADDKWDDGFTGMHKIVRRVRGVRGVGVDCISEKN